MNVLEFVVDKTGLYGIAMISVTAIYAGLFLNAAWELAVLLLTRKQNLNRRSGGRGVIRFFTAANDVVKIAAIAGFFMTLLGFQQVIEGFRVFDKTLALSGMSLAVMSSACYVPIVALAALWLMLTRTALAARPDLRDFIWGPEPEDQTSAGDSREAETEAGEPSEAPSEGG